MCGQVGVIYGIAERREEEIDYLKWLFTYLLLLSEERGPYATGIGWLDSSGGYDVLKQPVRATESVKDKAYSRFLTGVSCDVTWLIGHTRWPTRGSVHDPANNHPLVGSLLLTHNGHVSNASELFYRLKLPREAEVDSEIILRMAEDSLVNGRIDLDMLAAHLSLCRGQISAAMASTLDPQSVIFVKGNKPLELRYHPKHNAIIYASDLIYLNTALPPETEWRCIQIPPMSLVRFDCGSLPKHDLMRFRLCGQ